MHLDCSRLLHKMQTYSTLGIERVSLLNVKKSVIQKNDFNDERV